MADRRAMSDRELEGALREVGASYPYPPTPAVAVGVRSRIETIGPARWRSIELARPWRLVLAAAIIVLAVGAAFLSNPATRDAIAHFFHVRGVVVTRASALPSVSISPLNLGPAVTLDQAQAQVSFVIVVPAKLGAPDAVYVDSSVPGGEVVLAYKPRAGIPLVPQTGLGLLITEFRGELNGQLLIKAAGPGTTTEETTVGGDPAWWIAGQPHMLVVQVSPGIDRPEELRLASNTLVWEDESVTLRIESGLSKSDAMAIASQMP
jgi:hypothetical protein